MNDLLGETLVTYVRGPKGEAGIFETFEPVPNGEDDGLSAVLMPGADGKTRMHRLAYVVRLKESVRESYLSLGEAYLAAGNLVGIEAGMGYNPGRHLTE